MPSLAALRRSVLSCPCFPFYPHTSPTWLSAFPNTAWMWSCSLQPAPTSSYILETSLGQFQDSRSRVSCIITWSKILTEMLRTIGWTRGWTQERVDWVGPVCRWRCLCECAACVHASVCVRVYPRGNWSLERKSRVEHRLSPFPHRSSYLRWVSTSESSFLLWLNMKTVLGRWSGKDWLQGHCRIHTETLCSLLINE